ncbi:hypothetical protein D9756_008552 [Leucocoprinus leucothites]|uniref:F-box domain-containing protein n=1 Tax=Leucocoprinus leucothites TaxID=201217 RepID=A0A8H5FVU1_9AGAR|nr:hypothetical protein D9756_008552 [Leucoagaricus leucothites]
MTLIPKKDTLERLDCTNTVMSAKEFYYRPEFHIGALPDELILEILRHATWVPYGIAPTDLVVKRFQSTEAAALEKEYRQSLVTKRYLVRVCKKWYRLAYIFLYEWILVARVKNLRGLVLAVEQSSSTEPQNHTLVGWCTRRLDIDTHRTGCEKDEDVANLGTLLLRLLRNLVNLEVLTVNRCLSLGTDYNFEHFPWLSPIVSHSWGPRLQFLNWVHEADWFQADTWEPFLRSHPHIIGINLPRTNAPKHVVAPVSFSHNLLTWNTGYISIIPISTTFTSLRRLSINLHRLYITDSKWEDYFIRWPIPSLTDLQLNCIHFYGGVGIDLNITLNTVHSLMHRFMPNLRRVELVLPVWPATWSGYVFPEKVEILGVRVCSTKPTRKLVAVLLQVLNQVVKNAHRPLTIQFLDSGTLNGVLTHEKFLVRHAKERNLLEQWLDCEGYEYKLHLEESPT